MGEPGEPRRHTRPFSLRELLPFVPVYFFLSLINLVLKLRATKDDWFNGRLDENHQKLLAFEYTNNEQSRLLQFLIPESFVRFFGLSVQHAYMVQRWLFVWLALVLFHVYLRRWFPRGLAFAGACLLAAVLPLTYLFDLQESAPFLMVSFLLGLWMIRDDRPWLFALVLLLGALANETSLVLPAVYFFFHFRGWRWTDLWSVGWRTLAVAAPAYLASALVRYINRNQPHLGGAWHLPDNLEGMWAGLWHPGFGEVHPPFNYLSPFVLFGALWLYAYLRWKHKPRFLQAALLMVPLFVLSNLLTGIISESRQMVPLAYIIIPGAFCWLFDDEVADSKDAGEEGRPTLPSAAGPGPG